MMFGMRRTGSVDASLFVQVAAVMAGAIIIAQATNLFVLNSIPPPSPETVSVTEIARAYMGLPPPEGGRVLVAKDIPAPTLPEQRPGAGPTTGAFGPGAGPAEGVARNSESGGASSDVAKAGQGQNGQGQNGTSASQAPGAGPASGTGSRGFRRDLIAAIVANGGPELNFRDMRVHQSFEEWANDRQRYRLSRDQFGFFFNFSNIEESFLVAPFEVELPPAEPGGPWRVVRSKPDFHLTPWQQRTVYVSLVTLFAVLIVAYLFARRLTGPFARLAESADKLGRDPTAPALLVTGPSEARIAAKAFNNMQERLRRYVEDRTAMIGAIAHDMRTPLTRLRFRIEGAPDDLRGKMAGDLDEMEAMISATLSFVRDATITAKRTKMELSSLLESLADELSETGSEVTVERSEKVVVEGDPVALKRLFNNLLQNALKYGKRARIRVFRDEQMAIVEIDDDGPGVPGTEMDRVFDPFYRREPSRNRDTGGIGLGLAVVRSVARAHGGDATLHNRPEGGLTARVNLPI